MKRTLFTAAVLTAFVATGIAQQQKPDPAKPAPKPPEKADTKKAQPTPPAPPAPPKPGAEQANLAKFAGTWKMDGKMEASPLGPAGPMTGTETCRMFEGGWHLVCESSGNSPMGPMKGMAIMTYDAAAKQYRFFAVNSAMPDAEMSTGKKTPTGWTWTSKMTMGPGKVLHGRFIIVDKSPTQYSYVWEMSENGKTWKKVMEGTSTKTGS